MNEYEIITVATHKYGLYEKLINNNFKINITTLGMGMKWTGFRMKHQLIYNYIYNLPDNKIIIYLDGYDSIINKDPKNIINYFTENNYKVLFSEHFILKSKFLNKIVNKVFFNKYNSNKKMLNCGLFMGYVKYLKIFLFDILCNSCKDDQVILNRNIDKYPFISIDSNNYIFENLTSDKQNSNSIFISYPGTLSVNRIWRATFEYTQFFIKYAYLFVIIVNYFIIKYDKFHLLPINVIFYYILKKMDKSCI